jgi:hypothetical protein
MFIPVFVHDIYAEGMQGRFNLFVLETLPSYIKYMPLNNKQRY